jgi:hypothetical protein
MFKNNDYSLVQLNNLKSAVDVFYYLWIFLFLPVLSMILFAVPMYYIFKAKNALFFSLLVGIILVAEYFLYTYFASQANLMNGIYNEIISVSLLIFLFFKTISSIFKSNYGEAGSSNVVR